jgi:catechol 2,3-dioxygenase-like lactoylglutathione lyase family enzyme
MNARLDHVVVWCEDPFRSLAFYEEVVGLRGIRIEEFREGKAPFPSVRVSAESIIDLMPRAAAPSVDAMVGATATAGHPVNHVCLAMNREEFEALRSRVEENGATVSTMMERLFGARGPAAQAFYFLDPDSNVIEARYYS